MRMRKQKKIKIGTTIVNHSEDAGKTLIDKVTGRKIYIWKSAKVTGIGLIHGTTIRYYELIDDKGLKDTIDDDDFADGHLEIT